MTKNHQERFSRAAETAILSAAILIVVSISALSYLNLNQTRARVAQTRVTRQVQRLNSELLLTITNAETGQRGFLLTNNERYLEPYRQARSAIPAILSELKAKTAARPEQARTVGALEGSVTAKLRELQESIDLTRSKRLGEAVSLVNTGNGQVLMDEIRVLSAKIDDSADQFVARYAQEGDRSSARLRLGTTLGSILLLGLVVLSAIIISRGLKAREDLFLQSKAARDLLQTTLSSIADAVISTDRNARVTFMNPVAEQLTGWQQQDALGRHISEIFPIVNGSTGEKVVNPLEDALAQGRVVGLAAHTKLIARDRTEVFIDDTAAPICDEDGTIIGGVLVFRDISAKRQVELELDSSAVALQKSNEELQHFAYAASHDLRSPLNSITAMAQLLVRRFGGSLGHDGDEMIGYIMEGAGRMSRLIEDLLSLATASNLAREIDQPTSMEAALQTAWTVLGAEVQESGATITYSDLPRVRVRDTHVIQILQNVLGNAVKYRGEMSPVIRVSAAAKGNEWVISVRDNGIGFDPKYSEQIFLPFKRLHGSGEYKGSGIGLFTCKRIVGLYGGRIWAESTPGEGSTFFFSLPASHDNQQDLQAQSATSSD